MYIDSHTHFDIMSENSSDSLTDIISEMKHAGVSAAVQISTGTSNLEYSRSLALAHRSEGILFSAGIHPSHSGGDNDLPKLDRFVSETLSGDAAELIFGIGECGLDYHYDDGPDRDIQMKYFEFQIDLANRCNLPLIVHSREAWNDTAAVLKSLSSGRGIMHCFPGGKKAAREALDMGFYISFAGNATFKKALEIHEAAQYVPIDRILAETDAPYLSPVPLRGKPNRPSHVIHTYEYLAKLRKQPLEELTEQIQNNFSALRRPSK